MTACPHPLCALIGGACSLATHRSRGCTPGLHARELAPAVLDEVRVLVAAIADEAPDRLAARVTAARRLAQLARAEAREDRNLVALVHADEPELGVALARLVRPRG